MANVVRSNQFIGDLSTLSHKGNIVSGTYTPTVGPLVSNLTNITFKTHQYLQYDNIVTIGGAFTAEVSATSTLSRIRFSLPFDVESLTNLWGFHAANATSGTAKSGGMINADDFYKMPRLDLLGGSNVFSPAILIKFNYIFQYLVE